MSYDAIRSTLAYQAQKGRPYDPAISASYPPFERNIAVIVKTAERSVSSKRTSGFPRVKPENPYSVYIKRYGEGGPIVYGPKDAFVWPYIYEHVSASSFTAVNPSASLLGFAPTVDQFSESEMASLLRRRVLDTKVNLAVLIGESRQTVSMVLETASTLARAYSQVRRGNLVRAADILKVRPIKNTGKGPASNWLAYHYGWVPLLSDVRGSAEHLARRVMATPFTQRVNVTRQKVDYFSSGGYSVNGSVGFPTDASASISGTITTSSRATVVFQTENDKLREMSQLGFMNPALVAWELVPFSFVVDWFLPIGNFLEQFNAFTGLTIQKSFINYRQNRSMLGTIVAPSSGTWQESDFSFSRSVDRTFSVRFPTLELPNHNVVNKIVTSLALFRQRI